MEWKEAAKWIGILVAAGLVSTAIELLVEWKFTTPAVVNVARAEARAEVDRVMTAAVQRAQARTAPVANNEPKYVQPQQQSGYIYQV